MRHTLLLLAAIILASYCSPLAAYSQEVRRPVPIVAAPGPHNVVWANLTNATVDTGNTLLTSAGSWNNGGSSSESLPNGVAGYVELTVASDACNCYRMFGLGQTGTGSGYSRIDFAFYLETNSSGGGLLHYSESASISGAIDTYSIGDVLRVERNDAGVVTYLKNGAVIWTSGSTSSTSLYANGSTFNSSVHLENISLSGGFQ